MPSSAAGPSGSKTQRLSMSSSSDGSELKGRARTPGGSRTFSRLPEMAGTADAADGPSQHTSKRQPKPVPFPTPFANVQDRVPESVPPAASGQVPSTADASPIQQSPETQAGAEPLATTGRDHSTAQGSTAGGQPPAATSPVANESHDPEDGMAHSAQAAGGVPPANAVQGAGLEAGPGLAEAGPSQHQSDKAAKSRSDSGPMRKRKATNGSGVTSQSSPHQKHEHSHQQDNSTKRPKQAAAGAPAATPPRMSFKERLSRSPLGKFFMPAAVSPEPGDASAAAAARLASMALKNARQLAAQEPSAPGPADPPLPNDPACQGSEASDQGRPGHDRLPSNPSAAAPKPSASDLCHTGDHNAGSNAQAVPSRPMDVRETQAVPSMPVTAAADGSRAGQGALPNHCSGQHNQAQEPDQSHSTSSNDLGPRVGRKSLKRRRRSQQDIEPQPDRPPLHEAAKPHAACSPAKSWLESRPSQQDMPIAGSGGLGAILAVQQQTAQGPPGGELRRQQGWPSTAKWHQTSQPVEPLQKPTLHPTHADAGCDKPQHQTGAQALSHDKGRAGNRPVKEEAADGPAKKARTPSERRPSAGYIPRTLSRHGTYHPHTAKADSAGSRHTAPKKPPSTAEQEHTSPHKAWRKSPEVEAIDLTDD